MWLDELFGGYLVEESMWTPNLTSKLNLIKY